MPRTRRRDTGPNQLLESIRGLLATIHQAESRPIALTAAVAWVCRAVGANECRFLTGSGVPPEPQFYENRWLIPAYTGGRLAGGLELLFTETRDASEADEVFLRLCAEVLVWAADQVRQEQQASMATRRFLQLEEAEKRRIGRDLHDNAAQQLAVVRLQMEMLQMSPKHGDELFDQLASMREVTEKTIADVRRLISDLSPSVLEQLGLMAAIRQLANRFSAESGCEITVHAAPPLPIDADTQLTIYRLVQSAFRFLTENLLATHLNISLDHAEGLLGVTLQGTVRSDRLPPSGGALNITGTSLWDRVILLGGSINSEYSDVSAGEANVFLRLEIPDLAPVDKQQG